MLHIRIRKRRKEMNYNQVDMASMLGITRQGYGHYRPEGMSRISKCFFKFLEF